MQKIVALCDVDGTLYRSSDAQAVEKACYEQGIFHNLTARFPLRLDLVAFIEISQPFIDWYCWSGSGANYAEMFCRQKNIAHLFKGFYSKHGNQTPLPVPAFIVDDEEEFVSTILENEPQLIIVPNL